MAFLCPSVIGRKPAIAGEFKVYALKKARRRKLQTLKPLLPGGGETNMEIDQEDDSDSGISQVYSPGLNGGFSLPDIAKTELATRLAAASPGNPAFIRARVLWQYEAMEPNDFSAEKGEIVQLLHREGSRVFAVKSRGQKGFLPFNYCTVLRKNDRITNGVVRHVESRNTNGHFPVKVFFHDVPDKGFSASTHNSTSSLNATKLVNLPGFNGNVQVHRSRSEESLAGGNAQKHYKSKTRKLSSSLEELTENNRTPSVVSELIRWDRKAPETFRRRQKVQVSHFRKFENDAVMVLFDFHAGDENDVNVQRGEVVTVMNRDDEDWLWIMRDDGEEGFIPRSYVSSKALQMSAESTPRSTDSSTTSSEGSINQVRFQDPLCTIHSYVIEDSNSDSESDDTRDLEYSPSDSEDEDCLDSKWSTWC